MVVSDKIEYKGQGFNSYSGRITYICYFCCEKVSGVVPITYKLTPQDQGTPSDQYIRWLLCPSCSHGSVLDRDNKIYPTAIIGEEVNGLKGVIAQVYDEAKKCISIQAYTACELLCRKLLMHVAVDKGAEEGKSFESYITFLQDSGYITPPMKKWVDLIRTHGNESTHTIEPASEERARNTITFTAMLLKLVYETEHFALKYAPQENNEPPPRQAGEV